MRMLLIAAVLALGFATAAGAVEGGASSTRNAGDQWAMEFQHTASDLADMLESVGAKTPFTLDRFRKAIQDTDVTSVRPGDPLLLIHGISKSATNAPHDPIPNIAFDRTQWEKDTDIYARQVLVMHEYLWIMEILDPHNDLSRSLVDSSYGDLKSSQTRIAANMMLTFQVADAARADYQTLSGVDLGELMSENCGEFSAAQPVNDMKCSMRFARPSGHSIAVTVEAGRYGPDKKWNANANLTPESAAMLLDLAKRGALDLTHALKISDAKTLSDRIWGYFSNDSYLASESGMMNGCEEGDVKNDIPGTWNCDYILGTGDARDYTTIHMQYLVYDGRVIGIISASDEPSC